MRLRLLDLGDVGGLRSQTVWHALAEAMGPEDAPILALQRPVEAYVSTGFHRSLSEIDLAACARRGLAVYRRRVGGGPVYCDGAQLFFQLIVPVSQAPAVLEQAWRRFMGPAVDAFRRLGVDARLSGANDIVAGDRKVSGLGAATIGHAMVFVGNVILDFDYGAMVDVLALRDERFEAEVERLMRRYLAPVGDVGGATSMEAAREAVVAAYGTDFGDPVDSLLTEAEAEALARVERTFLSADWLAADRGRPSVATKIRSGVGVLDLDGTLVSYVDGRIERVSLADGWVPAPGMRAGLERALAGSALEETSLYRAAAVAPEGRALAGAILDAHRRTS